MPTRVHRRGDGQRRTMTGMADQTVVLGAEETAWSGPLAHRSTAPNRCTDQVLPEGWSAKDLLAHVGAWPAEAELLLEGIAAAYRRENIDVDDVDQLRSTPCVASAPTVKSQTRCRAERRGVARAP